MPDREAFIAAIAAAPADDLPRLVFADWLDENGEAERAEFIRVQVRYHHADDEERKGLNARAEQLFREHWRRWLEPFLAAFDPHQWAEQNFEMTTSRHAALTCRVERWHTEGKTGGIDHLLVGNGFVSFVQTAPAALPPDSSVATAFAVEPPYVLNVELDPHKPAWARFTHPALRRVEHLTLDSLVAFDHWPVVDLLAAFHDPHLAGVRHLTLSARGAERPARRVFTLHLMREFIRSPLAYRLQSLELPDADSDSVRSLASTDRLGLRELSISGREVHRNVARLAESPVGRSLRRLVLDFAGLDDAAVGRLAECPMPHLTHLNLNANEFTAEAVRTLANARFTPRLEVLDLSENPHLFRGATASLAALRALGDALNPALLRYLHVEDTGLASVPDFLAERFGDRVTI